MELEIGLQGSRVGPRWGPGLKIGGQRVGIEVMILRADVDDPIGHCRRGTDDPSCGSRPELSPALSVKGIEVMIFRADVDHPVDYRRRRLDGRACGGGPELGPTLSVKGIQLVIDRANVDHPVDYRTRG